MTPPERPSMNRVLGRLALQPLRVDLRVAPAALAQERLVENNYPAAGCRRPRLA
jgi:hypothetical protein